EIRSNRSVGLSPEGPAIGPRSLADEPSRRFRRDCPRGGVAMARRGFAILFDVCLFRLGGSLSFVRGEEEAHVTPGDADAVMALSCRFHFLPPYPDVPGKLREPISALGLGPGSPPPGQGVRPW